MGEKVTVNKRDIMGLMNTIDCLVDQVVNEQVTSKTTGVFWSKKYSFIKAVILECKDINELNFIKRSLSENTLTEENWSTYIRRKKVKPKDSTKEDIVKKVKNKKEDK